MSFLFLSRHTKIEFPWGRNIVWLFQVPTSPGPAQIIPYISCSWCHANVDWVPPKQHLWAARKTDRKRCAWERQGSPGQPGNPAVVSSSVSWRGIVEGLRWQSSFCQWHSVWAWEINFLLLITTIIIVPMLGLYFNNLVSSIQGS